MTGTITRRLMKAVLVAGAVLGCTVAPATIGAKPAGADTCAAATAWAGGTPHPVGSCSGAGDFHDSDGQVFFGWGATYAWAVDSPVSTEP